MNDLDVLRRAFDAVPETDDEVLAAIRAAVLREIAGRPARRRRPRHRLRFAFAFAVAIAALLTGLFVAFPHHDALRGTEVAAAAYRALTPPHRIRHETYRLDSGRAHEVTERWVTTTRPYGFHMRTGKGEYVLGPCGEMNYDARSNLLSVTNAQISPNTALSYFAFDDPVEQYLRAYRSGQVSYRGKTTFRGVPAYKLVVSKGGAVFTYLVRRDNYYPLRTVRQGKTTDITTYLSFRYLPRNAHSERLLSMSPHPHAFLMHSGGLYPRKECRGFGSYDSVTGKGKNP